MTSFRIKSGKIFYKNGLKTAYRSVPNPPTEVTGSSGNGQISLVWTAPSFSGTSPITNYIIEYSTDGSSNWTAVTKPASTNTSYTVTGLTNAQEYFFRVAAINQVGTSSYSANSNSLAPFNYDPNKLVLVYDTSKESINNTITLHVNGTSPNILVDWGDGSSETFTTTGVKTKTYASPGIYVVQVSGTMTRFGTTLDGSSPTSTANSSTQRNRRKLVRCLSFGNIGLTSLSAGFNNSVNLIQVPLNIPSSVTSLRTLFRGCTIFNQPIGMWDTSNVTGMTDMFTNASSFNQPINNWNTSKLTETYFMFSNATSFNQPLDKWNMGGVSDAIFMFSNATSFNQPIEEWNTSNLYNWQSFFSSNPAFNQSLGSWPIYNFPFEDLSFSNTSMNSDNYNKTLIGWANFIKDNNDPIGRSLGANNRVYTDKEYEFNMPQYRPFWKKSDSVLTGLGGGSVVFGGGRFVSVQPNASIVSTDGKSWTTRTMPSQNWTSIAYGAGIFVAVSSAQYPINATDAGGETVIMRSIDNGETWTHSSQNPNIPMLDICYDGQRFVAAGIFWNGSQYECKIFSSVDGNGWSHISTITASGGVGCNKIKYLNGAYYLLDDKDSRIYRSTDGISWTTITINGNSAWTDIAYGKSTFVMVGSSGTSYAATSSDGISWQTHTGIAGYRYNIVYANGFFISVGELGIASSRDGQDWIRMPFYKNTEWSSCAYNPTNDMLVVLSDGIAAYSNNKGEFTNAVTARNYLTAPTGFGGAGWTISGDICGNELVVSANRVLRQTVAASSTNVVVKDSNYIRQSEGQFETDYNVQLLKNGSIATSGILTTDNTNVITNPSPSSGGLASFVFPGVTTIRGRDASGATASTQVVTERISGSVVDTFSSYVTGTAAHNATSTIDALISGKTAASTIRRFTTQNHTTSPPSYVANASFWASSIDFSCCSVWNSTGLNTMAGTLISPRHIIFAAHYQLNNGATVRFIDNLGNVVSRTMTAKLVHPDYKPYYPDIAIGVLDSDVPAGVSFARVLPSNWSSYLPTLSYSSTIPLIIVDQEEKALIGDIGSMSGTVQIVSPSNAQRASFWESIIVGDSGSPGFIVINNQLVIVTVLTYGGLFTSGTAISAHIGAINTMMNTLGGGYQLSTVNLSGFPTF
jgi:hypothetical protein